MTVKRVARKPKTRRESSPKQQPGQIQNRVLNDRNSLAWAGAIFLLHAVGLVLLFSPMQGVLNDQPIIEQDWGLHFHHLKSLQSF